jgi:hypothetical protein
MEAVLHNCLAKDSTLGWGPEVVTFRVFEVTRRVEIQPNVQIELVGRDPSCHG